LISVETRPAEWIINTLLEHSAKVRRLEIGWKRRSFNLVSIEYKLAM